MARGIASPSSIVEEEDKAKLPLFLSLLLSLEEEEEEGKALSFSLEKDGKALSSLFRRKRREGREVCPSFSRERWQNSLLFSLEETE